MTSDVGSTYRFAVPNPNTMMLRASLIIGTCLSFVSILIMCVVGLVPIYSLAIVLPMGLGASLTDYWGRGAFGRDSGVMLSPDYLVVKRGERRYAWQDMSAVALGTETDFTGLEASLYRSLFARFAANRARVSLRRPAGVGVPVIKVRTLDLYLAEPEAFVEEAQRYLASASTPSPAMREERE